MKPMRKPSKYIDKYFWADLSISYNQPNYMSTKSYIISGVKRGIILN